MNERTKRMTLIVLLIVTLLGAVLLLAGFSGINENFILYGFVIYMGASFTCGFVSGAKIFDFFKWTASDLTLGCLMFPLYMLVYPVVGGILCFGGWIFGLLKLIELSEKK
jgi:hypothetical protein